MKRFFIFLLLLPFGLQAQIDSLQKWKHRKIIVGTTALVLTAASAGALYYAWYSEYNSGQFHFFNDNSEWLQMDKAGHFYSTYQVGYFAHKMMRWSGFSKPNCIWVGGMYGSIYMTAIECMDGFSSGWGFSVGDYAANIGGSLLFCIQEEVWKESRIMPKFSFHATTYARYRPELLGSNNATRWLKDYNGQTYWLSISPFSFLKKEIKGPRWLCLSIGYGAEGMVSGEANYVIVKGDGDVIGVNRYRKLLLSMDIDFTKIPVRKKWLKAIFSGLNTIKFPLPAVEWSNGLCKVHGVYF